jgi:hypothetical protein
MTKSEAIIEKAVASAMGKDVIIREIRGKIVVTDKPDFKERILSEKQEEVTYIMASANQYAKLIIEHEPLRNAAQIRLNVTRERLYTTLVSEYWKNNWGKTEKEVKEFEMELNREVEEMEKDKNSGDTQ